MKNNLNSYVVVSIVALLISACGPKDDEKILKRSTLKIVSVDSLLFEKKSNKIKLSEDLQDLCSVLISDNENCNSTCILDPVLLRLDLNKEISLKTTVEKGGTSDKNNPKVIDRLIKSNLKELQVPKIFTDRQAIGVDGGKLMAIFSLTKSPKDSILIYSQDGSLDNYTLNNRKYKVYSNIEDIRNRMIAILCENEKANFTLFINPPIASTPITPLTLKVVDPDCQTGKITVTTLGGNGTPVTFKAAGLSTEQKSGEFIIPKNQLNGKTFAFSATQSGVTSEVKYTTKCPITLTLPSGPKTVKLPKRTLGRGILTIIKGSEGCEGCTRYYSGKDDLGITHEVRENNSINCCPCGKTVQINGRSYRMECSDEGNKLTLVD